MSKKIEPNAIAGLVAYVETSPGVFETYSVAAKKNGSINIARPSDVFGEITFGEITGTGSAVQTDMNFAGIRGFSIMAYALDEAFVGSAVVYAALNNTSFNDPQTPGQRWVIPVGSNLVVPCDGFLTTPTKLSIFQALPADVALQWGVVE